MAKPYVLNKEGVMEPGRADDPSKEPTYFPGSYGLWGTAGGGAVLVMPEESQVVQGMGNWEWGGAAGTYFWVDRKNDLVGVWMAQTPPFIPGPSKRFKVMLYSAME